MQNIVDIEYIQRHLHFNFNFFKFLCYERIFRRYISQYLRVLISQYLNDID